MYYIYICVTCIIMYYMYYVYIYIIYIYICQCIVWMDINEEMSIIEHLATSPNYLWEP